MEWVPELQSAQNCRRMIMDTLVKPSAITTVREAVVQLTSNLSGKVSKMTLSKKKRTSDWYHKRDKALERLFALYEKDKTTIDEWNQALDALTLAHTAAAFEGRRPSKWLSPPLSNLNYSAHLA
jgi:hypothetical protein